MIDVHNVRACVRACVHAYVVCLPIPVLHCVRLFVLY